jgi:hypothetical protein
VRSIELGLVLPMEEAWTDGSTPRWVEILLWPRTLAALEAMAPVLELLDAD